MRKSPITDPEKTSKGGKLDLIKNKRGEYETVRIPNEGYDHQKSELRLVYENGKLYNTQTFDEIRKLSEAHSLR